jgi:hypothetical protein
VTGACLNAVPQAGAQTPRRLAAAAGFQPSPAGPLGRPPAPVAPEGVASADAGAVGPQPVGRTPRMRAGRASSTGSLPPALLALGSSGRPVSTSRSAAIRRAGRRRANSPGSNADFDRSAGAASDCGRTSGCSPCAGGGSGPVGANPLYRALRQTPRASYARRARRKARRPPHRPFANPHPPDARSPPFSLSRKRARPLLVKCSSVGS